MFARQDRGKHFECDRKLPHLPVVSIMFFHRTVLPARQDAKWATFSRNPSSELLCVYSSYWRTNKLEKGCFLE